MRRVHPRAEDELRALCSQAWELRDSGYVVDAVRAIEDWHDRRYLTSYERQQQRIPKLVALLRATDTVLSDAVVSRRAVAG